MEEAFSPDALDEFLASAHVFAKVVTDLIEEGALREAAGKDITVPQLKLLKLVDNTEKLTIGGVAAFLGVSNAAASKAVDRLVRKMLLRRMEGESDRRMILLSLTEPGRRILQAYEEVREKKLQELFSSFSGRDFRETAEKLDRLSARIVEHSGSADDICLQCGIYFREHCLIRKLLGRNCFYLQTHGAENGA